MPFSDAYRGRRVLLTGDTGFKGSWLAQWLLNLGAEIAGYSLPPPTSPSLFLQLGLAGRIHHLDGDVRDLNALIRLMRGFRPEFVFHLAAQPLVRRSYAEPVETYETNVMGTVNILEAVRQAACSCAVVIVTTDKCYENRDWVHAYRETDVLGGYDPYSSSKACAELVVSAFRCSYFSGAPATSRIASVRAGNVIGGGDWAADRIVPDCIRALQRNEPIPVRNQVATRPWQHVLEPLSGYLWLGACLARPDLLPLVDDVRLDSAFNFGPGLAANRTVADLVQAILRHWSGRWEDRSDSRAVHEARLLNLATDKAHHCLGWRPVWNFERAVAETIAWYRAAQGSELAAVSVTDQQIAGYVADGQAEKVRWAAP